MGSIPVKVKFEAELVKQLEDSIQRLSVNVKEGDNLQFTFGGAILLALEKERTVGKQKSN